MNKKKLLFIVNVDWFFVSHRLPIAEAAILQGYEVYLLTKETNKKQIIEKKGIHFINLDISRSGLNFKEEIRSLRKIIKTIREIKPDLVHNVTIKPIVYGTIAARLNSVRGIVNAVSGLGYNFTNNNRNSIQLAIFFKFLRILLRTKSVQVIFQNSSDLNIYLKNQIITEAQYTLIKGSGVDLKKFCYSEKSITEPFICIFSGRLLIDKGIREYINAAEILKKEFGERIEFWVAGSIDLDSPIMIKESEILRAQSNGTIKYLGFVNNMISLLKSVNIVVLPSYYGEGVPKALIEAAAIGRPIITTNLPGCKDTIIDKISGFLVHPKSTEEVVDKIRIIFKSPEMFRKMSIEARKLAEKEFSIEEVIKKTLTIYSNFSFK